MWLVLCHPDDTSALWAGQGLRARGLAPITFASTTELVCASRLEYQAGDGQPPRGIADLGPGRRLDTDALRGTLNRATRCPYPQVRRAAAADRNYVQAELDAVLLAWLGALRSPVFNPPHPAGWAGAWWHPFAWALRAQVAGFATAPHRCGYSGLETPPHTGGILRSFLVFRGRTFPSLPPELEATAVRLAEDVELPLMGMTLAWTSDGRVLFVEAHPTPDLRLGGDAFLDALAAAFSTP